MSRLSKSIAALFHPAPEPDFEAIVRDLIHAEVGHYLTDIEWRYKQARDLLAEVGAPAATGLRQLTAEDMNVMRHQLTGYTVTNNVNATGVATPGSIRWQALHIVYSGVDYTITDGATSLKYTYFVKPASGTSLALTSSDTKPTLGPDDLLVFINNSGTAVVSATDGSASLPTAVANNAVDNLGLADNAVSGSKIADNGIGAGKIGSGAINNSLMFMSKVINNSAMGNSAVTAQNLNVLSHTLY